MLFELLALLILLSGLLGCLGMPWGLIAATWFCIVLLVVVGVVIGIGVQMSYLWFPIAAPIMAAG